MSNDRDPYFLRFLRSVRVPILIVGGFLSIALLGLATFRIVKYATRDRSVASVLTNDPSDPNVKNVKVGLGAFEVVEGTPYRIAPVVIEQETDRGYYSKSSASPTNYLILNLNNKSAIRLVPQNNTLFIQTQKIGKTDKEGKFVKVSGILYVLVKADTDGNKRLTPEDRQTIAVSDVSGANYTEVIPRVDRLLGTFPIGETNALAIYETGGKNFVTELDLNQRRAIATKELPAID